MNSINIYNLTRVSDNEDFAEYEYILSGRKDFQRTRIREKESLIILVRELIKAGARLEDLDNYFYSYTIAHISKEFDLLRISSNRKCILNIELKSEDVGEDRIKQQLVRNRYYLSPVTTNIYSYTFILDTNTLYRLELCDDTYTLVMADFTELVTDIRMIKKCMKYNIESLFKAKDYLSTNISEAIKPNDPDGSFLFLKLFTVSDGTLPSFVLFINFLGPLLGIALGFDAVNSEQNKGTLSRMLSQPIHRDCIINAKFVAALIVIGIMLFVLGFLVMGCGLIAIGIPPTAEEFWRIVFFIITSIFYVAFWLNLAILFSLRFRQAATSALASVAVWLFFSVFYTMIVNLVAKGLSPSQMASPYQIISYQKFILGLMRLAPSELFNEATTTLLMPSVRSLGPLTMEQVQGAIPSPLPLGQSLLVVWPQLTGLIAATVICFAISYIMFMRREIRSR